MHYKKWTGSKNSKTVSDMGSPRLQRAGMGWLIIDKCTKRETHLHKCVCITENWQHAIMGKSGKLGEKDAQQRFRVTILSVGGMQKTRITTKTRTALQKIGIDKKRQRTSRMRNLAKNRQRVEKAEIS